MQSVDARAASEGSWGEHKKRATRAALVEAEVRLAAEHGVENVAVDAISEATGVSPRTFFNYFGVRDEDALVGHEQALTPNSVASRPESCLNSPCSTAS